MLNTLPKIPESLQRIKKYLPPEDPTAQNKAEKALNNWIRIILSIREYFQMKIRMAIKIQSVIRMFITKRKVKRILIKKNTSCDKPEDKAATKIESLFRGYRDRKIARIIRKDMFEESCALETYREKLRIKPLEEEAHHRELEHIYKDKFHKLQEKERPPNEIRKHYIRPGLETPSYYVRTLPHGNTGPYNTDISKLELGLLYKIKYDFATHSQIKRNLLTVPPTDRWCMTQNGYKINDDGQIDRTDEWIEFYKEKKIEVDKSKPIPQAEYRNDFMKTSLCIHFLFYYEIASPSLVTITTQKSLNQLNPSQSETNLEESLKATMTKSNSTSNISQKRKLPAYYHTFIAYKDGKLIEEPPKIIPEKKNRQNRYQLEQVLDLRIGSHPTSKQKEQMLYETNRAFKIKHNELMNKLKQREDKRYYENMKAAAAKDVAIQNARGFCALQRQSQAETLKVNNTRKINEVLERSNAIFNMRLQKYKEKQHKWEDRINQLTNEFDEEFEKKLGISPIQSPSKNTTKIAEQSIKDLDNFDSYYSVEMKKNPSQKLPSLA